MNGSFAVLHVAGFALEAVLRVQPGAAGRPAALFSGTTKKSVVLATNPSARAQGVEEGMTAPQALARCGELIVRAPRPDAEAEANAALLAIGFSVSPTVEATAPGVCTLDLKGFASNPAPVIPALESAVAELGRLGLPATAGLARTPLLALYAARSPAEAACRFFHRVCVVEDEAGFLGPLPLAVADPTAELAAVFAGWGLRTLGEFAALPRDEIVRRFGAEGLAVWTRATGGAPRPLAPAVLPPVFAAAMEFEEPVATLEPLLFLLRRFLDRLVLELRAAQHVAAELELVLRLEDDRRLAHPFRLPEPTAEVEILFRAVQTYLGTLRTEAAIVAVELQITPTRPLVRQQGLFETGLRDPHGFAETLARVAAIVGSERVGTPHLEETHRPDAVKLAPPAAVIPPTGEPAVHPPVGLPLRRFRPPLAVRVEFTQGEPTYLWAESVQGEIASRSCAWLSSGEWWQTDRTWRRSEWDIALVGGGLYRLLLIGERFYLEGEYG